IPGKEALGLDGDGAAEQSRRAAERLFRETQNEHRTVHSYPSRGPGNGEPGKAVTPWGGRRARPGARLPGRGKRRSFCYGEQSPRSGVSIGCPRPGGPQLVGHRFFDVAPGTFSGTRRRHGRRGEARGGAVSAVAARPAAGPGPGAVRGNLWL